MDFDWKPLAGAVIKAGAPIIGGALAGPLGSAAGGMLGGLLANALGVEPTPEAVGNAIATGDPAVVSDALTRGQRGRREMGCHRGHRAVPADVDKAAIKQINATIREEMRPGAVKWWHWRHLLGYAVLAWVICPLPIILWLMLRGDITTLNAVVAALVSLVPLIGIAAGLNGYVAMDTSRLKALAVTGEAQPTIGAAIAKAVVPPKKR